ncbi:helicase family protein with metal-binding cysteine cluster [Desulfitobacterium dehalogenans ATCC 51507]|uniref:Helicase family protein with metal-binding cysteine cluster n=2 Tax=Desulfitobacterium dehalogenans TaxID=36854 RepID=I4A4W1_DESDJ|nr:helicase family protein with metal-binding cysteine cluster [Desulfitobacterium dehalogenans ATCC 51507]
MREKCIEARAMLFEKLYEEIVGPGSGETIENGSSCSLPDKETEVITDMPERRYYVGVLFPMGDQMRVDNDATRLDADEAQDDEPEEGQVPDEDDRRGSLASMPGQTDDTMDEVMALSTQDRPSSIGMTFIVDQNVDSVCVDVSFATYRHTTFEDCLVPYTGNLSAEDIENSVFGSIVRLDGNRLSLKRSVNKHEIINIWNLHQFNDSILFDSLCKLAAQCHKEYGFKRISHSDSITLPLDGTPVKNICGVEFAYLRAVKNDLGLALRTVTIMLYNGGSGRYDGTNTIFQPKLEVSSLKNPTFRIMPYDDNMRFSADEEERSLALLYHRRTRYASGHGISAYWNIDRGEWHVYTDLMPRTEVPQMDPDYAFKRGVEKRYLSLKYFSDLSMNSAEDKYVALESLILAYEVWIEDLKEGAKRELLSEELDAIAAKHILLCEKAAARMRDGITCLRNDDDAMRAFELTNRAMLMQMKHRKIVQDVPDDEEPTDSPYKSVDYARLDNEYKDFIWRPFQAAFFLMNIRGLTDTEPLMQVEQMERDRDIVDIIWFPTGGGKTEAYLALTAFTIFYRRLKYPDSSEGTAVLMRYTLRLLTSQQFARASTLICACDLIRKEFWNNSRRRDKRWKEPISIGLWIGGDHTPNKNTSHDYPLGAKEHLRDLQNKSKGSIEYRNDYFNKFQVLTCPWCGASLVPSEKASDHGKEKWGYEMYDKRHFYLHCIRPQCPFENNLPVQVVDQELYRNPPTLLFATVDKFAMLAWNGEVGKFFSIYSNNRAPELIIQDELHLISGPLGSIVGLYEAAIDSLCSSKGIRPKIVASTATIRRAGDQCRQLYNRPVLQFPPSGIDAADSFFAKEADVAEQPGRMYVGIFPSGKTKAMLQTKVMSTLLQYVSMLDADDMVKDQYWTLTGYFNSLRDLGKCSGLVDDDIKDFMKRLCRRIATDRLIRKISMAEELTSRVPTTALVKRLKKLEKTTYLKEKQASNNFAINVLLATNMISVGVDVDRLNLMTVVGQPKLTSEYIQATSRVGRKNPGLVCVLYDGTKSRDRSHYEQFHAYHESFYRYVEPTSVTPFSKPSLDRALHAVLVGIIRNCDRRLLGDGDAKNFTGDYPFLETVKQELLRRIESVYAHISPEERADISVVSARVESFFEEWTQLAKDIPVTDKFYYGLSFMRKLPGSDEHRLLRPFGMWEEEQSYATLTSMRNVDQSLSARMLIWEE